MVKAIITSMLIAAASVGAICLTVSPSYAFGDAPWCAVIELGTGDVYWDCEYPTVEACVPHVLAGNRGFCNQNPWPGPSPALIAPRPHHRWYHSRHRHAPNHYRDRSRSSKS